MCFSLVNGALALDVDIPEDLEDDRNLPREERIRRHQKRVQLILEARKKSKEEERQRLLEEARAKAQKASAAKKKTTPSRPPAAPPGKPGDAPSDALSFTPLSSKTLAQTILYFYPFDKSVILGENFLTDMELLNLNLSPIESLKVKIKFDPVYLSPVYVNDYAISSFLKTEPFYKVNLSEGYILYQCEFDTPQTLEDMDVLRIVWKSLKSTDFTEIDFDLADNATALLVEGKDILGISNTPYDGIIPTGISIMSPMKKKDNGLRVDPELKKGNRWNKEKENPRNITLHMETPKKALHTGDKFDVSLFLSNPESEIIDKLSLYLKFDPNVVRVVDWDKRNWISKGVNIQDGFARKAYPFDFHLRNDANNFSGTIDYRMGSSFNYVFPTGEFARIRFRVVKPTEGTQISFVRRPNSRYPNTSISSMGEERLSSMQWEEDKLKELSIQVVNP